MDDFSFLELTNIRKNKEGINEPVLNYTNESSETFRMREIALAFLFRKIRNVSDQSGGLSYVSNS